MENGTPIKGKKGWVHFGDGQLREFEYKKYLLEQKQEKKLPKENPERPKGVPERGQSEGKQEEKKNAL